MKSWGEKKDALNSQRFNHIGSPVGLGLGVHLSFWVSFNWLAVHSFSQLKIEWRPYQAGKTKLNWVFRNKVGNQEIIDIGMLFPVVDSADDPIILDLADQSRYGDTSYRILWLDAIGWDLEDTHSY